MAVTRGRVLSAYWLRAVSSSLIEVRRWRAASRARVLVVLLVTSMVMAVAPSGVASAAPSGIPQDPAATAVQPKVKAVGASTSVAKAKPVLASGKPALPASTGKSPWARRTGTVVPA